VRIFNRLIMEPEIYNDFNTPMQRLFTHLINMGFADAPFRERFLEMEKDHIQSAYLYGLSKPGVTANVFFEKKYKNEESKKMIQLDREYLTKVINKSKLKRNVQI